MFQGNYPFIHRWIAGEQLCQHKRMRPACISNYFSEGVFNLLPHFYRFCTIGIGNPFNDLVCC